jgi:isopenicillin N synthase-like dioxygenase
VTRATNLPVLDLAEYGLTASRQRFVEALGHAGHHVGFFYLTGHGIDSDLGRNVDRMARASRR